MSAPLTVGDLTDALAGCPELRAENEALRAALSTVDAGFDVGRLRAECKHGQFWSVFDGTQEYHLKATGDPHAIQLFTSPLEAFDHARELLAKELSR